MENLYVRHRWSFDLSFTKAVSLCNTTVIGISISRPSLPSVSAETIVGLQGGEKQTSKNDNKKVASCFFLKFGGPISTSYEVYFEELNP